MEMHTVKYILKIFFRYIHWILFFISISLSLMILFPSILQHNVVMLGIDTFKILEVNGFVYAKDSSGMFVKPVGGCSLEIGGYKVISDSDGKFKFKFISNSLKDIPVIIKWVKKEEIKRINFPLKEFKITEVFILE